MSNLRSIYVVSLDLAFIFSLIFIVINHTRGESHIDFHTQCVIMMLTGRGAITNEVFEN